MTELKNERMGARILETQGVTQPPHSAWKPVVVPCSQTFGDQDDSLDWEI